MDFDVWGPVSVRHIMIYLYLISFSDIEKSFCDARR
jgi:hypothetical protein